MLIKSLRNEWRIRNNLIVKTNLVYGTFVGFIENGIQLIPKLSRIMKIMREAVFIVVGFGIPCFRFTQIPQTSIGFPVNRIFGRAVFRPGFIPLFE